MTSHNENDSSPIKPSSDNSTGSESAPNHSEGAKGEGREGGQRRPRRQGAGKPFNKKRPFNKDRPRREGEGANPQLPSLHRMQQRVKPCLLQWSLENLMLH